MGDDPFGVIQRSVTDALAAGLTGLDLVLLAIAALTVLAGLRTGLLARLSWLAGIVVGLALSGRTVPAALELAAQAGLPARTFVAVAALTLTITLSGFAMRLATAPIRRLLTLGPLSLIDRALGAIASLLAFTLLLWLAIPTAAAVPGRISSEVRSSSLLGALDAAAPDQPDIGRTLRTLLGGERFPDVFASLAPTPEPSEPPEALGIEPVVLARAVSGSTAVRVVGCGRSYSGSGFAVDSDHVITNAHVVAGAREIDLRTHDGRRVSATVVVFDKDRDLALLHAPGHSLAPLTLRSAEVGMEGAAIGYPGGQAEPRIAPARIDRLVDGIGRDIYGRDRTQRSLHFLAAALRSGDSGAAVIDRDGNAVGVVFAVSPDVPTAAYALTADEVRTVLSAPRAPGDAGRCI